MMKMKKLAAARGFTLIELMIVVAIIGILAAIAIPNFLRYQLRTRRSEGSVNVAAIRTGQISYFGNHDTYVSAAGHPADAGVNQKRQWFKTGVTTAAGFDDIGFVPEGDVYFMYAVNGSASAFTATAHANLDNAGNKSCWAYGKNNDPVADPIGAHGDADTICDDAEIVAKANEKTALVSAESDY